MEGGVANNGGGGGGDSDMMEFGENSSSGLSSALMMMPLMNSGPDHITNTQFLPLPFNNNSNHQRVSVVNMFQGSDKKGHDQDSNSSTSSTSSGMKAKIMAHPLFPRLLAAYVNCQKVGAPPEVVARLDQACATNSEAAAMDVSATVCIGEDPALDQFMEAYCEMLTKYEQELTKPFKEAILFLSSIQCQLKALTVSSPSDSACGTDFGGQNNGSSEDDVDVVINDNFIDPQAEDRELKVQLLRKYSGYLGSLKQEFMKKKKNGKLPKEARQQLLDWWSRHYKWPYPSETQKLALAESTGLDLKQINNWFINQRKRHWKPSEDMQFVVMDAAHHHHHHHHPHYYMDSMMYNPFPMDCSSSLL
ncbi:hypothetical protein FNV43_RR13106 [Rhamnella rubrinervis]|uniref:Uncharacterized protein n=1 Tax=Rhamnella rubrinervis TaxID=2594499 RepID=A0A8K0H0I6_9ROSA|nr:hypothetical protein FNV43_RR13106 [Rhamnella rubrinervis]